ncbi:MAG: hypothetical protein KDN20_18865 [Verrucomicrobiae bacterium]|nr:hypothetical protein [Verrucomicrobiae bacterium]
MPARPSQLPIAAVKNRLEPEQIVSAVIAPHTIHLSRHVRKLASALRDRTAASPFAADTLNLTTQVDRLCDHVEQLLERVETLLAPIDAVKTAPVDTPEANPAPEQKKGIKIQRAQHGPGPDLQDVVEALFLWRNTTEQRHRDGQSPESLEHGVPALRPW